MLFRFGSITTKSEWRKFADNSRRNGQIMSSAVLRTNKKLLIASTIFRNSCNSTAHWHLLIWERLMKSKWPKELTYCWAIFAPSCVIHWHFIVAFFCDRPTQHNTHTGLTAFPKNVFFFSSYSFPIDFDWNEQNHPVCSYEPCNLYHSPWPSAYMYMCACVAVTYPFIVTMMSWFNCWTSQKNKPLSQFSSGSFGSGVLNMLQQHTYSRMTQGTGPSLTM